MYIMLRHTGQEGRMDLVEILLSSTHAELYAGRYEYTRDLDLTIGFIMDYCGSKTLIRLLDYSLTEPQYICNKIDMAMEQACISGYADVVQFMLEDDRIEQYITANLYALALKNSSTHNRCLIVRILLKHLDRFVPESNRSMCVSSALLFACSNGSLETVRCFLEDSRTDFTYERNAAISIACESGNPAIVRLLLDDDRVDPTEKAMRAAQTYEIIKMLVDDGRVDPSSYDNQALIDAITSHKKGLTGLSYGCC